MLTEEGKKVKKQLEMFNYTKKRLKILQEELNFWKNMEGAIISISGENILGGERIPYAERRLIKMEELQRQISETIDFALEQENIFLKDISLLDSLSQNLLMERYMTGKSLQKIMLEFNYSERNIYYLYNNAINKLAKFKTLQ